MSKLKLTKTERKRQKDHLRRFERYLPMLQLKKQQIQRELEQRRAALHELATRLRREIDRTEDWVDLLTEEVELEQLLSVSGIDLGRDNVAGVELPVFVRARLEVRTYDLYSTPLWVDRALEALERIMSLAAQLKIAEEQQRLLSRELRVTAQRVNLFEHVKIPESRDNIRRISIYLADQQTAAFGWAQVAKRKLESIIVPSKPT